MRQTVRLGRFAGIPVGVHWSVIVIVVLLVQGLAVAVLPVAASGYGWAAYWGVAVMVAALFLAALLAHELAHALVARHYGVQVRGITLWLLGGVSELGGEAPRASADLFIALAGPLVSLASAAVFAGGALVASAAGAGSLAVAALIWLAVVNAILALFNLLPGAPLDGGRVLAAILWWVRGDRAAARRTAGQVGLALGAVLVAAGLFEMVFTASFGGLWLAVLGWFLTSAAHAETLDATQNEALAGVSVGEVMSSPAVCGYVSQSVGDFATTVASRFPYRTFPVLDLDGQLAGLVSLSALAKVPRANRETARLADVQTPVTRIRVLDPTTPLTEVAPGMLAGGHRFAPVAVQGRLLGVLTAGDVSRAFDLAALGATRGGAKVQASQASQVGAGGRHDYA